MIDAKTMREVIWKLPKDTKLHVTVETLRELVGDRNQPERGYRAEELLLAQLRSTLSVEISG